MQLSKHFSLAEMTLSQSAERAGLDNTPKGADLLNLTNTANNMELVREILGTPILVSSGYRSLAVNKLVGGSKSSQHVRGEAVDFTSPSFGTPRQVVEKLKASKLPYDQLILEFDRWVHISFSSDNRKQCLVIDRSGTRIFA